MRHIWGSIIYFLDEKLNNNNNNRFDRRTPWWTARREAVEVEFRAAHHRAQVRGLPGWWNGSGTWATKKGSETDPVRGGSRARTRGKMLAGRRHGAQKRVTADEDDGAAAEDPLREARFLHRHLGTAVQRGERLPGCRLPRALAAYVRVPAIVQEPAEKKDSPLLIRSGMIRAKRAIPDLFSWSN